MRLSVPIWGFDKYKISWGAPKLTNSCKTFLHNGLLIPVVSLPSENVPAPPSPNWTFDEVFKILFFKRLSISFFLSSTFFPCSIIMGEIPFWTNVNAEKRPAGPEPTITGEGSDFKDLITLKSNFSLILFSISIGCIFSNLWYLFSSLTNISSV